MTAPASIAARRAQHERDSLTRDQLEVALAVAEQDCDRLAGELRTEVEAHRITGSRLAYLAGDYDTVATERDVLRTRCERWEARFAGFATEEELLAALTRLHDECSVLDRGNRNVRLNPGPMMAPSEQAVLAARVLIDRAKAASERLREERAS